MRHFSWQLVIFILPALATSTGDDKILSSSILKEAPTDYKGSSAQNTTMNFHRDRVCIIGSGNWGSAIATKVGSNCRRLSHFEDDVKMWVFEETIQVNGADRKLTEVINSSHENPKYLPGIQLPSNIIAEPELEKACRGATLLIFVLPHQFLPRLLPTIRKVCHPSARGVSLIKGIGK